MTVIERTIDVSVPVRTAYNQWTQFEDFPQFMGGVRSVQQLGDNRLHWRALVAGNEEEWDAVITEQVPDQLVAWRSTSGSRNAGSVRFKQLDGERTQVTLRLEYEPTGIVERIGDALGGMVSEVDRDLQSFKRFIELRGNETGAWRGQINGGAQERQVGGAVDDDVDPIIDITMRSDNAGVLPGGQGANIVGSLGPAGTTGGLDNSGVAVNAGRGSDVGLGGALGDAGSGRPGGGMSGGSWGGIDSAEADGANSGLQNDLGSDLNAASGSDQSRDAEAATKGRRGKKAR